MISPRASAATALFVFAVGALTSATAAGADTPTCTPQSGGDPYYSQSDVNGDGYADLIVGARSATADGLPGAGIVDVHYPHVTGGLSSQRFDESFFGTTPHADDNFGASSTFTHFRTELCDGLAIGAPGADGGTGAVTFAFGSTTGVSPDSAIRLSGAHRGDHFGASVASSDRILWVSAPTMTVHGHPGAGAIYEYQSIPDTLQLQFVEMITEDTPGIPGSASAGDHFGQALAPEGPFLAVGIPGKTVSGAAGAGAVDILDFDSEDHVTLSYSATTSQDSPGVPGSAEAGDAFGSSVTFADLQLAVGIPGEDIGRKVNAGAVQTFKDPEYNSNASPSLTFPPGPLITQESPTVPGGSETGDHFGAALQGTQDGRLYIGAPGESIGDVRASGDVIPIRLTDDGYRDDAHAIRLGGPGADNLPGSPQTAAHVGASLSLFSASDPASAFTGGESVVVGVPALDEGGVNTGEVYVSNAATNIVGAGVYQDSATPQPNEFYGSTAAKASEI